MNIKMTRNKSYPKFAITLIRGMVMETFQFEGTTFGKHPSDPKLFLELDEDDFEVTDEAIEQDSDGSMTDKEYVNHAGEVCPACGAKGRNEAAHIDGHGREAWGDVTCLDCGATWVDEWRLHGYCELEVPEKAEKTD